MSDTKALIEEANATLFDTSTAQGREALSLVSRLVSALEEEVRAHEPYAGMATCDDESCACCSLIRNARRGAAPSGTD